MFGIFPKYQHTCTRKERQRCPCTKLNWFPRLYSHHPIFAHTI